MLVARRWVYWHVCLIPLASPGCGTATAPLTTLWRWGKNMVEAGQTDVKMYPTLGKEFVIKRVEFVCNVTAKHDREETSNVAIFGQKKIKTAAAPGDIVAIRLSCQCHLRIGENQAFKTWQLNVGCKVGIKRYWIFYSKNEIVLHRMKAFVIAPGNFRPLLVWGIPILANPGTGVGICNEETDLLKTLESYELYLKIITISGI